MLLQRIFYFVLFGSIFISLCAVALCIQTNIVLGLPLNTAGFYIFVFGATLVQYNLHYVSKTVAIDGSPRLHWSHHQKKTHYFLIVAGVLMIIYGLITFPLHHYVVLFVLGIVGFAYSFPFIRLGEKPKRLKDFGLLKIITLSLMWTLVTVWFPANQMGYDLTLFTFIFVKRFIFVFILCLLFDIRDHEVDARERIKTLSVLLGRKKAYILAYLLLLLFVLILIFQTVFFDGRFFFPFLISAGVTAYVINYSSKNNSDITCLFAVDGMMLLQSILIFLFSLKL